MAATDLSELTGRLMVSCSRFTRLVRNRTARDHSISDWRALAILSEHGAMRVTEFARADQLTQPTATAIVNRLVADGVVERMPDPTDGRAALVRLTPVGHDQLAELRRVGSGRIAPLLESLSEEERAVLAHASDLLVRLSAVPEVPDSDTREESIP